MGTENGQHQDKDLQKFLENWEITSQPQRVQTKWSSKLAYLDWIESKANDYIGLNLNLLQQDIPKKETDISTKELWVTKRFILFVGLFAPLFNWSHQEADIFENKFFFTTNIHFFACVANFPLHWEWQAEEFWWSLHLVWK